MPAKVSRCRLLLDFLSEHATHTVTALIEVDASSSSGSDSDGETAGADCVNIASHHITSDASFLRLVSQSLQRAQPIIPKHPVGIPHWHHSCCCSSQASSAKVKHNYVTTKGNQRYTHALWLMTHSHQLNKMMSSFLPPVIIFRMFPHFALKSGQSRHQSHKDRTYQSSHKVGSTWLILPMSIVIHDRFHCSHIQHWCLLRKRYIGRVACTQT